MSFKKGNATFWGTQYHPEFNFNIMSRILVARKSMLINEKIFKDQDDADKTINSMENIFKKDIFDNYLEIGDDILDSNIRNKELHNWLNFIEKN